MTNTFTDGYSDLSVLDFGKSNPFLSPISHFISTPTDFWQCCSWSRSSLRVRALPESMSQRVCAPVRTAKPFTYKVQNPTATLQDEGSQGHEVGQGEMRLQALRKQLKRLAAQGEALKAEVAELKRRGRTADLYKKKVCLHCLPRRQGWLAADLCVASWRDILS